MASSLAACSWYSVTQALNGIEAGYTMGNYDKQERAVRAGSNPYVAFTFQNCMVQYALLQVSRALEAVGKRSLPWWTYTIAWMVPAGIAYVHSRGYENKTVRSVTTFLHDKVGLVAQAVYVASSISLYRNGHRALGAASLASYVFRVADKFLLPDHLRKQIQKSHFVVLNAIRLFIGDSKSQRFGALLETVFLIGGKILNRITNTDSFTELTHYTPISVLKGSTVEPASVKCWNPDAVRVNEAHLMTDPLPSDLAEEEVRYFLTVAAEVNWESAKNLATLSAILEKDDRWRLREKFDTASETAPNTSIWLKIKDLLYRLDNLVLRALVWACKLIHLRQLSSLLKDIQLTHFVPRTQVEYVQRGLRILVHRIENRQILAGEPKDYEALLMLSRQLAAIFKQLKADETMPLHVRENYLADMIMQLGVEGEYCGAGVLEKVESMVKGHVYDRETDFKARVLGILQEERYERLNSLWRAVWYGHPSRSEDGEENTQPQNSPSMLSYVAEIFNPLDVHFWNQFVNGYGHMVGLKSISSENDPMAFVSPFRKWLVTKALGYTLKKMGNITLYEYFLTRVDSPEDAYNEDTIIAAVKEACGKSDGKSYGHRLSHELLLQWFETWYRERNPEAKDEEVYTFMGDLYDMESGKPKDDYLEAMLVELGVLRVAEST